MATTIINPPDQYSPVLTSNLYSVKARTDKTKVLVEIVRDPDGEIDKFFSTTLYPHNGVVELSDIGSLIEERFRSKSRLWDMMEIRIDGAVAEFMALYCEYSLDPEFDYTQCFLCAAGASIVHRNSAISLAHWSNGSNEYRVQIVGIDIEGNTVAVEKTFTRNVYSNHVSFSVNDIIRFALNQTDYEVGVDLEKVAYFSISQGSMQKLFYVVDHPFFLTFGFRNMFNAYEYIDVVGVVTRKTKFERDTAVCSGRAKQYNQSVERTYEMQTGPLTDEQIREVEQLIGSRNIQLCASGFDYDIIITDHSIEVDNDDESLSSIKFTFRFVGERPMLIADDMGALMPSRTHIFSHEFTAEFA